jgi:tetratricopeptide (TPR) repeat protein
MQSVYEAHTSSRRLDSWKEIAAFFGRDESTVKRWEKERALPVHRVPGSSRGRVFAFADELSKWMNSTGPSETDSAPQESAAASPERKRSLPAGSPGVAGEVFNIATPQPAIFSPTQTRRRRIVLAVGAALAVGVSLVWLVSFRHRSSPVTIPSGSPAHDTAHATPQASEATGGANANPQAQELYLKGRYYWDKRTPADLNQAVDFFNQAIARDPNYAQAYVGLADCYNLLREYSAMPPEEAYPRALAAARKAVELDESSAEAHNSLAFVTFYWNWNVDEAEREFRRALELNPKYVVAHHWYATFLMTIGRLPEALEQIDQAQRLDPGSTPILADKALILCHQGHTDQAITLWKQLEAAQPTSFSTHQYMAYIYLVHRDYANYLEQARKSAALSHDESQLAILHAAETGFQSGGGRGMLENILAIQKKLNAEGRVPAFVVATTCAYLGNKTEALRYLQISERRHEASFTSIRVHQAFFSLHDDPSFRNLVMQAGLPPLP